MKQTVRWLYLLTQFAVNGARSRNWKALLMGLPAVVVGGIMLGILSIGQQTSPKHWQQVYNAAAVSALKKDDFATADVYFRRMAVLDGSAPTSLYGLALAAAGEGDEARARSLMQRIAPEDVAGYPPAHFWLARDMFKNGVKPTPKTGRVVEHHLLQALAGNENKRELHALLGRLYVSLGDLDSAIRHYETAAREWPELKLTLATLYAMRKDTIASQQAAISARDYFRQKTESEPKSFEYRLQWAKSEVFLEHYGDALGILQAGLESADPQRFREALADVYLSWCESVRDTDEQGLARRLELLNLALAHNPKSLPALLLLAGLTAKDGEAANKASAELEQALARGVAPATAHAILGAQELQKGNFEKARAHLELAYERNPQTPVILNNLAWALANGKKPDLERALQLAQAAKNLSNQPEISATIGTILARMGRHREAVTELESALRAFPDRPTLHSRLAELYEKLGDAELANIHRRLAQPKKASP